MHARVQRLKHIFGINIETCPTCRGSVMIIARIEDSRVIEKILSHLNRKTPYHGTAPVTQVSRSSTSSAVWPTQRESTLPPAIAAALADWFLGFDVFEEEQQAFWCVEKRNRLYETGRFAECRRGCPRTNDS